MPVVLAVSALGLKGGAARSLDPGAQEGCLLSYAMTMSANPTSRFFLTGLAGLIFSAFTPVRASAVERPALKIENTATTPFSGQTLASAAPGLKLTPTPAEPRFQAAPLEIEEDLRDAYLGPPGTLPQIFFPRPSLLFRAEMPKPKYEAENLFQRLRERLDIKAGKERKESAAWDKMIKRLLESATARELAVEFLDKNLRARVSLADISSTRIYERTSGKTPRIILNRAYLEITSEPGQVLGSAVLGQALFGPFMGQQGGFELGMVIFGDLGGNWENQFK